MREETNNNINEDDEQYEILAKKFVIASMKKQMKVTDMYKKISEVRNEELKKLEPKIELPEQTSKQLEFRVKAEKFVEEYNSYLMRNYYRRHIEAFHGFNKSYLEVLCLSYNFFNEEVKKNYTNLKEYVSTYMRVIFPNKPSTEPVKKIVEDMEIIIKEFYFKIEEDSNEQIKKSIKKPYEIPRYKNYFAVDKMNLKLYATCNEINECEEYFDKFNINHSAHLDYIIYMFWFIENFC